MQKSIILIVSALCLTNAATFPGGFVSNGVVPGNVVPGDALSGGVVPGSDAIHGIASPIASFICPALQIVDAVFPFSGDCSKFYSCSHGEAEIKTCPEGLYFNEALPGCDLPENCSCDIRGVSRG